MRGEVRCAAMSLGYLTYAGHYCYYLAVIIVIRLKSSDMFRGGEKESQVRRMLE